MQANNPLKLTAPLFPYVMNELETFRIQSRYLWNIQASRSFLHPFPESRSSRARNACYDAPMDEKFPSRRANSLVNNKLDDVNQRFRVHCILYIITRQSYQFLPLASFRVYLGLLDRSRKRGCQILLLREDSNELHRGLSKSGIGDPAIQKCWFSRRCVFRYTDRGLRCSACIYFWSLLRNSRARWRATILFSPLWWR